MAASSPKAPAVAEGEGSFVVKRGAYTLVTEVLDCRATESQFPVMEREGDNAFLWESRRKDTRGGAAFTPDFNPRGRRSHVVCLPLGYLQHCHGPLR